MKSRYSAKRGNKDSKKIRLGLSETKQRTKFSIQIAMEPYIQLGTGRRCKAKECGQPVYDHKLGLCSYHRMMESVRAFEDRLKARQQQAGGESRTD